MAVIPEELIDRVSLHPNTLPTEAEARDGAQIVSENSVSEHFLAAYTAAMSFICNAKADPPRGTDVSILGCAKG